VSAATEILPCVEIEPERPARSAVIWLHGLGADGHDFVPVVPMLGVDEGAAVRFVFPHAPPRPVSINAGMVMPAWYDLHEADLERRQDEAGIRRADAWLCALIERELARGIASSRVVLAGFSQGGAVATFTALRYPRPLAGLIALSTYLVGGESLDREASLSNKSLPVFQAHGAHDPLVLPARGRALNERLRAHGCDVTWKTYPMDHSVCAEEVGDIGRWMNGVLKSDAA